MKNEEEEFQQDNEGGSFSFKLGSNDGGISSEDWLSVSDEERKGEDSRRHRRKAGCCRSRRKAG